MRLALSAVLALLTGAQAFAITIPQGTYKLKWKPVIDQSRSGHASCYYSLKPLKEAGEQSFAGLVSANARWAVCERFLAVVDESGGTGTGFDVAYVLVDAPASGEIDMKKAARVPLSHSDSVELESDEANPVTVDWRIGAPGAQIARPNAVIVRVNTSSDGPDKPVPTSIAVGLLGGWYCRINTDGGPVRVEPRDNDGNGIFNDKPSEDGGGDTVDVLSRKEWPGNTINDIDRMTLGSAGAMDGKLYVVKVSAAGDEVQFSPYTGGIGKVKMNITDPHGKALLWDYLSLSGPAGSFSVSRKEFATAVFPPGDYSATAAIYPTAKSTKNGSPSNDVYVFVSSAKKLRVEADKTAVFKAGGEIDLRFTVDGCVPVNDDLITLSRSKGQSLRLEFTMGGGSICGGNYEKGAWRPVVTIRDHSGKAVRPSDFYSSITGSWIYIDKQWALGDYSLEVKLDMGSYQKPISMKKIILVTE